MIGNTLEEASDLLANLNFIPDGFGRYKLKRKLAVVDYIKPNKAYLARRKEATANMMMGGASTFTNEIQIDRSLLVNKRKRVKPVYVIKFRKEQSEWFTVWNDGIIAPYKGEEKQCCMYAWVFGLNGRCIRGRTWSEFIDLINYLVEVYDLSLNKRLIIYVHNLSYEFQWFKNYCERYGCKIEVVNENSEDKSPEEEMVDDLISIIHVFSCRIYGLRKYKRKEDLLDDRTKD